MSAAVSQAAVAGLLIKPKLTFRQIFNMSFGFFGIQFGFALQNGNASRMLRTFGADVEHLSWFWLAAPLVGMIVQPIVGHYSDRTWNRFGRRKPYFLAGAVLSAIALCLMPNASLFTAIAPALFVGAGMLMIMDACFNLAMEPFRALVADNLPDSQRTMGFSVQTFLIGAGAIIGSAFPFILTNWFGVSNSAEEGIIAANVKWAFYIGAVVFIIAILVTVLKTKEYPPKAYEQYHGKAAGEKQGLGQIFKDFVHMPKTMKQLGLVQFFSWFALFGMWVFTNDAVATHTYGLSVHDKSSDAYRTAGDWVGILFSVYNGVSAVYALTLPFIAAKIGRKQTHAFSLFCGAVGLISVYFIHDPNWLILSMIGIGMAWASILAMPYVILAGSIPAGKMGIYMGIFNFFITLPQLVNGIIGGPIVKYFYNNQPVYAILMAGFFMFFAAISVIYVYDPGERNVKM
ncbi:MFS transporter [Agriterribacter sp.]|uniref:MFS transporter n=1 Tax=Agriterribacter sp. TaxID=2821509 RepID=UPI002BA0308F|nr:MFS transporter [Agriterribacter sp.]HTN07524.1 MFS transporter [Agriterribacter sp.]